MVNDSSSKRSMFKVGGMGKDTLEEIATTPDPNKE
jgi:hypothetical protein